MDELRRNFESVKQDEAQRNEFFEFLLQKVASLELENGTLRRDLKKTTIFCDDYMADVNRGAAVIANLQSEIMDLLGRVSDYPQRPQHEHDPGYDSTPFVVVLIEGEENMLMEEHIKEGVEGGKKAATKFYDHLMEYLTQRKVFENDWRLIIKFYASMSNFGTSYIKSGVVDDIGTWRRFIDGFNDAFEFCYFVDAGDNQATAESKMQSQLELFFGHTDCQHTVLIGSSDGSYTGFLRQYSKADDICGWLTLIEAIPSVGEFQELAGKFLPKEKESLFRNEIVDHFTPPASPTRPFDASLEGIPASLLPGPKPKPLPLRSPPHRRPASPPTSPVGSPTRKPQHHRVRSPPQSPVKCITRKPPQIQCPVSPHRSPVKSATRRPLAHPPPPWNQIQLVRRKPLATVQPRTQQAKLPRPKHATFFNAKGQRIDPRSYANVYTERYLQC
ncbi:hypothetical protein PMZ80_010692 [Knufia obscura]|uniref:DUF7923 domain-containing protein n=2 Tax=Knufia TaxID=430999 RepID=A0AAN8EH18_9EURO|nr:hypothetical protein PMZ80_010692 [Knufia obscura]KAK5955383.1 hypothetical protein OHC33_004066 [Knufia fluminis]